MGYQANKPQASDKMSVSQGDLLGNFTEVNTAWNANHIPFNLGNEGSHWFLMMPNQTVTPGTFPPATIGIYNSSIGIYASGGNLWFRPAGQAAGSVTNDKLIMGSSAAGWCILPSGIKLIWFNIAAVTSGTAYPIPVGGGYPALTVIYMVQVTAAYNATALSYPVCFQGQGGIAPNFTITLNTKNSAGDAGAKILIIGN